MTVVALMLIVLIVMLTVKSIAEDPPIALNRTADDAVDNRVDAVDDRDNAVDNRDEEFILMSCFLSSVNAENDDVDNDALVGRVIDDGRVGEQ